MSILFLSLAFAQEPVPPEAAPSVEADVVQRQEGDVSLNRASAADLATIEGVSEQQAEAVVSLRAQRGRLNSVEELRIVPELSPETLDALREHTTIDVPMPAKARKVYKSVDEVLAEFDSEPSIQDVQSMAMDYTHTNRAQVERWLLASKRAAALPEFKVRYYYQDQFDQDFDYLDNGASFDLQDGSLTQKWNAQVEAKWRLDDLVMNSERIRVISESQDVVKLRDKVLGEVTRLYFDRRRLQVETLLNPPTDLGSQVETQLRLMELTAELDAYTGGAFSDTVVRSR
jgi:hypothetical protein